MIDTPLSRFPVPRLEDLPADYRELLPQIDAAVVATPTATHRDVALDLIERNRQRVGNYERLHR